MIRLSKSCLSEKEKEAVKRVLDTEFLGMGPEVKAFEEKLEIFFERPVVCVVNGTAALHLSLQACGIGLGDEVIVPSLTYLASFQAITACGAKPVACDIDNTNFCLNPDDIKELITTKTKAIMPVHYAGSPGNLDEIYKIAEIYNLRIIEDSAHAFGSLYKNKKVGSFGDISCFSFDGIKNITSGEGGCIVSSDEELIKKVKDARLLGVCGDSEKRYSKKRSWEFDVKYQGWRYHMSDIMAAIGIAQLDRFDNLSYKRQELAKEYQKKLSNSDKLKLLDHNYDYIVPHIFVVEILLDFDFKEILESFSQAGIAVGRHYQENHKLSFFQEDIRRDLPVTNSVANRILTLPLHPDLTINDVAYISKKLLDILDSI